MDDISVIKSKLSLPSNIAIITHRNPDGDAIGSSLALKIFLELFGHNCSVILPSEYPTVFKYLPQISGVSVFDINPEEVEIQNIKCKHHFLFGFQWSGSNRSTGNRSI